MAETDNQDDQSCQSNPFDTWTQGIGVPAACFSQAGTNSGTSGGSPDPTSSSSPGTPVSDSNQSSDSNSQSCKLVNNGDNPGTVVMPPDTITASPPPNTGAVVQPDGTVVFPPDSITANPPQSPGPDIWDKPPINLDLPPNYDPNAPLPGPRAQPGPPDLFKPIPPAPKQSDPIDDALDKDAILKSLPKVARDALKGVIKSADETIVDKALDNVNTDAQTKAAMKAFAKASLQTAKGRKADPAPPPRGPEPSAAPPMPDAPGRVIVPSPTFKW